MVVKIKKHSENVYDEVGTKPIDSELNPFLKDIVKSNIDVIILKMLSEKAMCGFDLIKEINLKYNVLLSQGTVYPLLYSLKEDGVIQCEHKDGNMRSKIYFVTHNGQGIIENRMTKFIAAYTYFVHSIQKER